VIMLELKQEILEKRYFLKDDSERPVENWGGLCLRVSRALALEKSEEERFFDVLSNCLFLPNTPALANAGTERSDMSFSACFVLPVGDSMAEIFEAVKQAALIQKSGGGTGFSFSRIRPSGDVVGSTKGIASGPCSFIHVFDSATETIKQGSLRRGANMGILRVDHPDIMEFIGLKREEGRLSNFNLSVGITDRFMEVLKENREFELVFGGRVRRTLRPREIWDQIVDSAWRNGEPGLVFLDVVNRFNLTPHLGDIEATNPCITGDTLVATPSGYRRADTFRVGDEILTVCGVGKVGSIEVNHDVPVFEVEFSDGGFITVSASHQFHAIKYTRGKAPNKKYEIKMLKDLREGDWVRVFPTTLPRNTVSTEIYGLSNREYGFLIGILLGDGTLTEATLSRKRVKIGSNQEDIEWNRIIEDLLSRVSHRVIRDEKREDKGMNFVVNGSTPLLELINSIGLKGEACEKRIPFTLYDTNAEVLAGLLDGLISTDGNVNLSGDSPALRYSSSSRMLIADIRNILLMFGIHCSMGVNTKNRASVINGRKINGGPKYELIVAGTSLRRFYEKIGLTRPHKRRKLFIAVRDYALTGNIWRARIKAIRPVGTATVYDLFEPETDTWITNGYVSRGCGEQPLLPYEACVLGSVNLSKMVRDGSVDMVLLGETVRTGVRMLDNVIDVQGYPLSEIERMHKGNRKIGLGVMGWADMLLKLGIPYGSDRALELAGKVMSFITQVAVDESQRLALIKGVFPNWEGSLWYVRGLKVRNATLTTVAPTGSISIIAGCSSGIEPVFDWVTVQKRPVGEYRVVHPVYESWQQDHPSEPLPSWFVTAREIPFEWHIRMQAAFQKHVNNAVSKTVNLPREATREDVSRAFLLAYELGCKGITVYRDGSRALQVISSPNVSSSRPAGQVELPSVMEAKRVCVETSEGKVYVNISFHESIPREVFISTPVESKHSEVYESFARIFSVALRHGVPLSKLISQLEKANAKYGSVVSVPYALVRAFRLLGVNGEAKCPDCGTKLALEEGCLKCHCCGFSKC